MPTAPVAATTPSTDSLRITGAGVTSVVLPSLRSCASITVDAAPNLATLSLPHVDDRSVGITNAPLLSVLSLPSLREGDVFATFSGLTSVELQAARGVSSIVLRELRSLVSVTGQQLRVTGLSLVGQVGGRWRDGLVR
jgi:hypothetical protein